MKDNGLIDEIIKEPLGGAHRDREAVFESVKKAIEDTFKKTLQTLRGETYRKENGQIHQLWCLQIKIAAIIRMKNWLRLYV